jgi:phage-related protein
MPETLTVREPRLTGQQTQHSATVIVAEFEGGYRQRARPGPNGVRRRLSLEWPGMPEAEAETLLAFLKARGGAEAFFYTPPGESAAVLWTCASWSDAWVGRSARTVTAQFEEEFDLV